MKEQLSEIKIPGSKTESGKADIKNNDLKSELQNDTTEKNNIKFVRIRVFQDTAQNLEKANPILLQGEWGMETDTGRLKIGDGVNNWLKLPYKIDQVLTKEILDYIVSTKEFVEKFIEQEIKKETDS